jgi:hypothetical protein
MWIRYDDKGQVSEGLYAVSKSRGQNRKGKVGRCEQLLRSERGSSVSKSRDCD